MLTGTKDPGGIARIHLENAIARTGNAGYLAGISCGDWKSAVRFCVPLNEDWVLTLLYLCGSLISMRGVVPSVG